MKKVKTTLDNLKKGQRGLILEINIENKKTKRHLLDLGVTRGTIVEIKKIAPTGDPIGIGLRDYELCVAKKDLEKIIVETLVR